MEGDTVMNRLAIAASFIIVFTFGACFSQINIKSKGSDGWGYTDKYEQYFEEYNIKNYFGEVRSIDTATPLPGMAQGIQLTVTVDGSDWFIHLGPAWFFLRQDNLTFSKGDQIEIKGFQVMLNGKQVIMPSEVIRKDRILMLRDDEGIPYWSAYRKKNK